ncbi:MAG: hypothetical protein AMJ73_09020 [candidate division Zixibacteria bacterium SM1_73]|nr:MAG: hypothetical protein AMJ73_09020 [candidate division Zixibacteria bacterium SM1_73]
MMRSPERVSTAVRKADGDIVVKNQEFISLTKRNKILGLLLLRGIISFVEMLVIGIKSLNYSAEVAVNEAERLEGKQEKNSVFKSDTFKNMYFTLTVVFALALGIGIFFFLPLWFSQLSGVKRQALAFNLVAGLFRVTLFILYVWGISRFGEFKKVFQYHGAEHKSIFTYESGRELTLENVREYGTRHPRCGTSFILIVAVFAILVYSVSDTIYYVLTGVPPTLLRRFAIHFCLLPLVAGVGYELLKLSAKTSHNRIVKFLIAPGLWIQRITTQEPSDDQLEVAIVALQNALGIKKPALAPESQSSPSS